MEWPLLLRMVGQDPSLLETGSVALRLWVRIRTDLSSDQRQHLQLAWDRSQQIEDGSPLRAACEEIAAELEGMPGPAER